MKTSSSQIGSPGPFEVRFDDVTSQDSVNAQETACITLDEAVPRRRYDCASYDRCLELAAALNWESFTCRGCSGRVNDALLWRVGQALRHDTVAKALCSAPKLSALSGSSRQLDLSKDMTGQTQKTPALCSTANIQRCSNRRPE
jgi:hypothetical protein